MPRIPLIRSVNNPYHVTTRTNNKEWFDLELSEVWEIASQSLKEAHVLHRVNIVSFVLMNNHYHLLLYTPEGNLDLFMYEFNKRFAIRLKNKTGRVNKIFGGRYKWCLISSQSYFYNCYRYVYQNPIRAGLVDRAERYEFSTLKNVLEHNNFIVPLHDSVGFKDQRVLNWINERFDETSLGEIKKKLYRAQISEL